MLTPPQAVVEDERPSASSRDADAEATRRLRALDRGTWKIGDGVARGRHGSAYRLPRSDSSRHRELVSALCPHYQFTSTVESVR